MRSKTKISGLIIADYNFVRSVTKKQQLYSIVLSLTTTIHRPFPVKIVTLLGS